MNLLSDKHLRLMAAGVVLLAAVLGVFLFGPALLNLDDGMPTATTGSEATVIRVIDGDTLAVEPTEELAATNEDGTEHVVRILGIDAPEMHYGDSEAPECGAQEATDRLGKLLPAGARVHLVHDGQADHVDRYGRSLAYVDLDDATDAGTEMTAGGYATAWYPRGEPEPERFTTYRDAATEARDAGTGSWATCDIRRQP